MASIKDVARSVGCSTSTVSRVVNDRDAVDPETRRRVLEEGPGHVAALDEDIRSEAGELLDAEGEIELALLLELVLLRIREHGVAELLRLGRREGRHAQWVELSIDPELRCRAGGDVKVAGALLDHRLEQLVHVRHLKSGSLA